MESDGTPTLVEAIHHLASEARITAAVLAEHGDEPDLVAHIGRRLDRAVEAYDEAREFAAQWAELHGGRPKLTVVVEQGAE